MKKNIFIVFLLTFILTISLDAQDTEAGNVKSTLNELLKLSKEKLYKNAAAFIAYKSEDEMRNYNSSYNPANQDELNQVKRICKKIAALIELSSNYSIGNITFSKEGDKELATVIVNFSSGNQLLTTEFHFLKLGEKYLLKDMN